MDRARVEANLPYLRLPVLQRRYDLQSTKMEHSQPRWGRPRDDVYGAYDKSFVQASDPKAHTLSPVVTGSSVVGMKFKDGVIIAADNQASYGSLRRFIDQQRIFKVGEETLVGIGGDISDLQTIQEQLESLEIEEAYDDPSQRLKAPNVHSYLQRVLYGRRSKLDPFWNAILVAGLREGEPYLAFIDLLGTTYTAPTLATGFGNYLAVPLLRKLVDKEGDEKNVSEEQARTAIAEAMKVLFYRDGRALDKYTLAVVKKGSDGKPEVLIENDVRVKDQNWSMAKQVTGFGTQKE